MTHRDVRKEDFVGKTITDVNCAAANVLRFKFDDGTTCALEGELFANSIPIIQWCDHCGTFCESEEEVTSTNVDVIHLRTAIRIWANTAASQLPPVAANGLDLYLQLVASAARLSYEETARRFRDGDKGIVEARRSVKRQVFERLLNYPPSILQVHDEHVIVAQEPLAVESKDAEVQGPETSRG